MALGDKRAVTMAVASAVTGNIPIFGENGQLRDSGKQAADFASAPLDRDLTLYVDAASGDDGNDGLAPERSKKTIQAAIDGIPRNLGGHSVTVQIADGDYTDQSPRILGFYGGVNRDGTQPDILIQGASRDGTVIGDISSILSNARIGITKLSVRTEQSASGIYCIGNAHIWDVTVSITISSYSYAIGVSEGFACIHDVQCNVSSEFGRCIQSGDGILYAHAISGTAPYAFGIGGGSPYPYPSIAVISQNNVTTSVAKYSQSGGTIIFEDGVQV